MKSAKKIFEQELSGEPLHQSVVIEAIQLAQMIAIKSTTKLAEKYYTEWYIKNMVIISPIEFKNITKEIIKDLNLKC